jgi:hypothetical protein
VMQTALESIAAASFVLFALTVVAFLFSAE